MDCLQIKHHITDTEPNIMLSVIHSLLFIFDNQEPGNDRMAFYIILCNSYLSAFNIIIWVCTELFVLYSGDAVGFQVSLQHGIPIAP